MNFDQFVRGTFDSVSPSPPNMGGTRPPVHPLIDAHGYDTKADRAMVPGMVLKLIIDHLYGLWANVLFRYTRTRPLRQS